MIYLNNGYRIYVDIMTREKLSLIQVANMDITQWSVCSSSRREGDGVKRDDAGMTLFQPATSVTLLKYVVFWCKIQVIMKPVFELVDIPLAQKAVEPEVKKIALNHTKTITKLI